MMKSMDTSCYQFSWASFSNVMPFSKYDHYSFGFRYTCYMFMVVVLRHQARMECQLNLFRGFGCKSSGMGYCPSSNFL